MTDDITTTLKWWIQHANELEKERDLWKKVATAYYMAGDRDSVNHAGDLYELVVKGES